MVFFAFMFQAVNADVEKAYQDKDANTINIEGTAGNNYVKLPLTLSLKNENGDIKDIRLVKTDELGLFNCVIPLNDVTEKYTLTVKSIKSEINFTEKEILCFETSQIRDALTKFKSADSIEKMKSVVEDVVAEIGFSYGSVLGFDAGMLDDIANKRSFYEKLCADTNINTANNAIKQYEKIALCEIFNCANDTEVSELLEKYSGKTGIAKSPLYNMYQATNKEDFANLMANTNFDSIEDILDKFEKNVVLTLVKNSTYYTDTKNYIIDYSDILEINLNAYNRLSSVKKNNVMKLLTGYSAKNVVDFAEKFNNVVATVPSDLNNSPSGNLGGGSGGGSGGAGSTAPGAPVNSGLDSVLLIPSDNEEKEVSTASFVDLEDVSWAKNAILSLASKGIVSGKKDFMFCPSDNITRAEFVKILVGVLELDIVEKDISFTDVTADDWSHKYIATAVENGIVNGVTDTLFGKDEAITRQDMVTMTVRALVKKGVVLPKSELTFADEQEIASYAKESVSAAASLGIVNGVGDNRFAPVNYTTRAEASKLLYEVMKTL